MALAVEVTGSSRCPSHVIGWTIIGNDNCTIVLTGTEAEGISGSCGVVRTCRAGLQNWSELDAPRQIGDRTGREMMPLVVERWPVLKWRERIARIARIVPE